MDKAALLINAYCDNDLSDVERQQLVAWLHEDPAHVDRLAREFRLHSRLYDLLREQRLQSVAWSQVLEGPAALTGSQPLSQPMPRTSTPLRRWMLAVAVLAASVVAFALFLVARMNPVVVAQVTSTSAAAATSDGTKVLAGALLPKGETLRVDRGYLLVTFGCGAKVRIDAPARFIVEGKTAGTLVRGSASAGVPAQAIGFAIHTPLADVIDLGTEFRVRILDEDRLELHVFDGLVEVWLNKRFDHADDGPLKISEGRAARFDAAANAVVTLEYNETLRQEF